MFLFQNEKYIKGCCNQLTFKLQLRKPIPIQADKNPGSKKEVKMSLQILFNIFKVNNKDEIKMTSCPVALP